MSVEPSQIVRTCFFTALFLVVFIPITQSQGKEDRTSSSTDALKTLYDGYVNLLTGKRFDGEKREPTPIYLGFGIGAETGLSLIMPKVSYYNFQNRKNFETYFGFEGTLGVLVAQWYALNCLYGVKKNNYTFDTSIGALWYPKQKFDSDEPIGPYFHLTMNPKIGVKFWRLWLKAGPSIFLYKDYPNEQDKLGFMDFGKIGNIHYNFEMLVNLRF